MFILIVEIPCNLVSFVARSSCSVKTNIRVRGMLTAVTGPNSRRSPSQYGSNPNRPAGRAAYFLSSVSVVCGGRLGLT